MRLTKLTVENFRCYQTPFSVGIDDFTALIGKNDIGKSALFEALSIFFDQSKMDKQDASITGDASNVKITCEFSDLPSSLIIDANHETSLAQEYLLNENGNLEIIKIYDASRFY